MSADGITLKEAGQAKALDHADAVTPNWSSLALEAIRYAVKIHGHITSDNIRKILPAPPHHNAIGAAFSSAAKLKIIKRIGYQASLHPAAHGRAVAVWCEY
jgi:hypothetical protein